MKKKLLKKFCATAIGSVPHTDAGNITKYILKTYKDIPFWPQMPKRSFFENMYTQFIEGFPVARIDEAKERLWIDSARLTDELEKTYERVISEDYDYFAMSKKHALGFYEFLSQAKGILKPDTFIKGHITGPISFGLSVTTESKQPILYHTELSELLSKILSMKVAWQIRKLKSLSKNVIIFIDEPYLVSIGSSVVNIKKDDATSKISELVETIHKEGALCGIHCCGNTDWSLLLGQDIDILNFDAYNFSKSLALYPDALKVFLKKGGSLAWGIVPTQEGIGKENITTLTKRLEQGFKEFADKGIERDAILNSSIITPSCGCGTLSEEDAKRVFGLTVDLSEALMREYGK